MEKIKQEFIDIVKILPEKTLSDHVILWKDRGDGLIEIRERKIGFVGGRTANPVTIKRFVPINELLFEGFGLRFGDGSKTIKGEFKVFGFTNNQIKLHKHFLKFSKNCFDIESSDFNVKIMIPHQLKEEIGKIETNVSKELNIPREKFWKTQIKNLNKPCIEIVIYSTLLGFIIKSIFEKLKTIMLLNENFIASFLRGLIASEGSVSLGVRKRLEMISIAAKEENERDFIRKLLLSLNIIPNKDGDETVLITGLSNFKIMKQWKLCSLHPDKFNRFISGLKKIKRETFRKGEGKLLTLKLLSTQPRTAQELSKELNRSFGTIRIRHLIDLEKSGFVKRKGRINNCRIWKITKEGLILLKEKNPFKELKHINFKD